jgi:hydrogenase large subunit
MAVTHYLEALDLQKEIVKIHTIFGGKNPHPNWLVGGVPCPINVHSTGAVGAINMERLNLVSSIIEQLHRVQQQRLYPGRDRHRRVLPQLAAWRRAVEPGGDGLRRHPRARQRLLARQPAPAARRDHQRRPVQVHEVDVRDPEQIQEFVDHSWYDYGEPGKGLHPWDGVTEPNFELGPNTKGTRTNIKEIDEARNTRGSRPRAGAATRWRSARWPATSSAMPSGHEQITDQVTGLLRTMDLPVEALFSTLGRTAARALEASIAAELQKHFFDKL